MRRNLAKLAGLLAPPSCYACRAAANTSLCPTCLSEIELRPGRYLQIRPLDQVWAARPYEGVARDLVAAVKFRRLLPAIHVMAELIAAEGPDDLIAGALVPVPADPVRRAWRGFDAADLLTIELGRRTGLPVARCLRRRHGARQVGRSRHERLGSPPSVSVVESPPGRLVLVDDVITTGVTLAACARALRAGGAENVEAIAFAASGLALARPASRA